MTLVDGRPDPHSDDRTCPLCGSDGGYVIVDGESVCQHCAHTSDDTASPSRTTMVDAWQSWWQHRRSEYDSFTGDSRVRMVGGFPGAYVFENDF